MGKSKTDRAAEIQALIAEREAAREEQEKHTRDRAAAERLARAAQKRVRELTEKIAQAVIG